MATYYIDPTAPFDGNGLGPDPAASPGGLGARNVWPTSLANNTYLGKRGTSYKQTTTYISVNNNVVMDSYGDSTLPKHEIWSDSSNSVAVWVYASSSATIENMKFSGGSTRPFSVGASVNNLTVRGCEFSGTVNGTAISNTSCWLDGGATPTSMGPVLFEECNFSNAKFDLVYGQDIANVSFLSCIMRGPQKTDPGVAWANGGGDCIQLTSSAQTTLNNILISNCTLFNDMGGKHGIILGNDTNTTSTGIIVTDCTIIGGASVVSIKVSNVKIRRCILTAYGDIWKRGNTTSTMLNVASTTGSVNLVVDSVVLDGAGLSANGLKSESALPSSTPTFRNMTITGCLTNFILWDSTLGNSITLINCLYDTRVPPTTSVVSIGPSWTLISQNNLYAQNQTGMLTFLYTANIYGTLTAAQGAGYEVNSILGDPLLSSINIPLLNSPVIGTGSHIKYTRDALNTQRPNPPSIGAYEYIEPRNTALQRETRV